MKKIILLIFFFVFVATFYTAAQKKITNPSPGIHLPEDHSPSSFLSKQNDPCPFIPVALVDAMDEISNSFFFEKMKCSFCCVNALNKKFRTVAGSVILFQNDHSALFFYPSSVPLYILFHSFLIPFESYA